jgi:AbrB family looped-hinge helix DNA binding protein
MPVARITTKGQITIPAQIRRELAIREGDTFLFEIIQPDIARIRVIKRKKLTELYGALPATRPYPGKEFIRNEVGENLGQDQFCSRQDTQTPGCAWRYSRTLFVYEKSTIL